MGFVPKSLKNEGSALLIEWSDGTRTSISWKKLRDACPCAVCRVERSKPPAPKPLLAVLAPGEARPLAPTAIKPVGNYAYAISFSDGHSSGIYSLDYLRELGDQQQARGTGQ